MSLDKFLMVVCGDGVMVAATHNAMAAGDVVVIVGAAVAVGV